MEVILLILLGIVGVFAYIGARNHKRREVLVESLLMVTQMNEAEATYVAQQVSPDMLTVFAADPCHVLRKLIKTYDLPQSASNKSCLDLANATASLFGTKKI